MVKGERAFPAYDIIFGELNSLYNSPVGVYGNCASTLATSYCLKLNRVDADLISSGDVGRICLVSINLHAKILKSCKRFK